MKPDHDLQRAHERQEIIERAVKIGVKSVQVRGKNHVEMNAEELGRLVDRCERFEELLKGVLKEHQAEDRRPMDFELVDDIRNALAGR